MITFLIHEMFHTFQGEGEHMGKPAFFVRTFGCPVKCPWCDSAGTWHPRHIPKDVQRLTSREIADLAHGAAVDIVVITGGEPAIHNLFPLTHALHEHGLSVHLETSGGFELQGGFDWVTVSPKRWKCPLPSVVRMADEFKVIVEAPEDIEFYWNMLLTADYSPPPEEEPPIWLHPEWGHREDPIVLNAISEAVKANRYPFRAGWQLHKLYRVDSLDNRTRPLVPLGGDEKKGY